MTGSGTLRFDVVDVFAERAFAGNPLAVVHGASGLSTPQLQALAKEFNLSETVFPLPAREPGADYRARIFTPAGELPFAGHPSVGVAWVLARDGVIRHGDVVQECGAGMLPVHVTPSGARVDGGRPTLGAELNAVEVAGVVGLGADDVVGPAQVVGAGVDWAFLAVRPGAVARAEVPVAADVLARTGRTGLTVVAFDPGDGRTGPAGGAAGRAAWRAHLRFFAPGEGVPEDPATGSAVVALGVWLVALGWVPGAGLTEVRVDQGEEMGRPSRLDLSVEAVDGRAVRSAVGGSVVPVSTGEITVPPAS